MKKPFCYGTLLTLLLLIAGWCTAVAQTTVHGVVMGDKEPVPFANVAVFGTYEGTVSDDSGRYMLKTKLSGKVRLGASSIGMEPAWQEIELNGHALEVNFKLKEAYASLSPVTITAGTFAAGEEGKAELLKPRDIGTTAGSPGDIQATIEVLPGTQRVGYTEGLFVRGGSGRESQYIVDEMIYPHPYYSHVPSLKQRGRLDPFLFSGTVFSAGGYSARYGQALSSLLILESKGLADSTVTGGGIHTYGGNVFHTHRWKKVSVHANGAYNNLGLYHSLARSHTQWTRSPENMELRLVLRVKPNPKGLLKVYVDASGTSMGIGLSDTAPDAAAGYSVRNANYMLNTGYSHFFADNKSSLFTGFAASRSTDKVQTGGTDLRQSDDLWQGKAEYRYSLTNNIRVVAGGEYLRTVLSGSAGTLSSSVNDGLVAVYSESEATFANKLALRVGFRTEFSSYTRSALVVPRTSFSWKVSRSSQFSFSYGIFNQLPDKLYMLYNPAGLMAEKAAHYIANYQYQLNDRTLRLELYYKKYDRLVPEFPAELAGTCYGYARGFEVFFRDRTTIRNLDAWISYSLIASRRNTIIPGEMITPEYVSAHSFALVGKYWIAPLGAIASATYQYATPRNFNRMQDDGSRIYLPIPAFSTIDISISKPLVLFRQPAMLFFSVQNLAGHNKILGYVTMPTVQDPMRVYRSEVRTFFIGLFFSMYNN